MTITEISPQVLTKRSGYSVKIATSPQDVLEAQKLRHQVYCLERGFLPSSGNIEVDEFDKRARHVVARQDENGQIIGTARLVLPSLDAPKKSFPLQQVCAPGLLSALPQRSMAEVSRFAISKELRTTGCASPSLLRLGLMRGLIQLCDRLGLTHLCAIMEPTLLRLFRASAIHFNDLGPLVDYHGRRQPCYINIDDMLSRVRREKPEIWAMLTDHGKLWQAQSTLQQAA